jgi:hypothetical protein
MKKTENLSKWDYTARVPGLVRLRSSGNYYSRVQLSDRRIMRSLGTNSLRIAKDRHRELQADAVASRKVTNDVERGRGRVGDLLGMAKAAYVSDSTLSKRSKVAFGNSDVTSNF